MHREKLIAARVLLACAWLVSPTAGAGVDVPPSRIAEIFREADGLDRPGCSVGVARDGKVLHSSAYGAFDLATREPLHPATVFNIGSVSKQFTGFAVLLLAQRGQLSLDDSVRKYVPELGEYAQLVTIRHLLHHVGGLRDYIALLRLDGHVYTERTTREQAVEVLGRQRAANDAPGTLYEYSNTGYFLLGLIVERLSGRSLAQFLRENVFLPLGMRDTSVVDRYPPRIARLARGYVPSPAGFAIDRTLWEQTGDGQVHTTVLDMARWADNFYTGKVGGRELIRRMREPFVLASGARVDYGAGLSVSPYRGLATVRHGGDWAGFRGHFLLFPEQRFAVTVLCNAVDAPAFAYTKAVAHLYLGPLMSAEESDDQPALPQSGKAQAWVPTRLDDYAGTFTSTETRVRLRIVARNGGLVIDDQAGELSLEPGARDEFVGQGLAGMEAPFRLQFTGNAQGVRYFTDGLRGIQFERQR